MESWRWTSRCWWVVSPSLVPLPRIVQYSSCRPCSSWCRNFSAPCSIPPYIYIPFQHRTLYLTPSGHPSHPIPSIWCTPKELIGTALVFLEFQYELEHRIMWPIKPSCLESVIWKFYWKGSHPNLKALLYVSFPLCMEYYASPKSKPSPKSLGKPLGQVFKPGFVSIIIHKNLLSLSRHYFASPPSLFNVINQHNHDHYHYHHHHYQL